MIENRRVNIMTVMNQFGEPKDAEPEAILPRF